MFLGTDYIHPLTEVRLILFLAATITTALSLTSFPNACVACKPSYEDLKFIVFDTQTQDGVLGVHSLESDIAVADGIIEKSERLWQRPESGKHL